ncbi:hypothetical protein Cob_v011635 [Colletotrichum orbiculare MAFF 240422]|uniref:Dynactin arp1 p25 subunit n=1 Tax=Colletotrichum orbiculare (strain 104-T / ATCC 96160 / CBS 514.97 / LARS 414 / MAFF 240422) TaxID=1213857 RepID=A0A484FBR2_COLOR|nr:hypothetical protein Cob_v011635 [Colletotrichum orbiculare MAFF 240422]
MRAQESGVERSGRDPTAFAAQPHAAAPLLDAAPAIKDSASSLVSRKTTWLESQPDHLKQSRQYPLQSSKHLPWHTVPSTPSTPTPSNPQPQAFKMRSFVTCTVLASVASLVAAGPSFEYPAGVPAVEKRQEPGTPRYACHENCGLIISLGREEGYCDSSEWKTRYSSCLECANEFGIWMYYGSGVTNAAKGCGLTPVPSPSGGAVETTAAPAPATTTAAPAPVTTTTSAAAPPAEEEESSSSSAAAASTSAAAPATTLTTTLTTEASSAASASGSSSSSAAASGTAAPSGSSASATRVTSIGTSVVIPSGSPTPSAVFAGASRNTGVLGAVGVVGLVVAAAL